MILTRRFAAMSAATSILVITAACGAPSTGSKGASEYPSKTVKIIVPYAAGGPLDSNARILADCLGKSGGQWVVENQEGGGGTIGVNNLVRADLDGHTLAFLPSSGVALTPLLSDGAQYDKDDLQPISILTNAPAALLVRAESPYRTAEEFFAAAKSGTNLSVATAGALGLYQLIVKELAKEVTVTPVPFDGTAPAVTAALGGNTDAVFAEVSGSILRNIESGRFRALATGADEPAPMLPGVPTLSSLGYELEQSNNYGLLVADKDVSADIVTVIEQKVGACSESEDVKSRIGKNFVLTPPITGAAAKKVIDEATAQYQNAIDGGK